MAIDLTVTEALVMFGLYCIDDIQYLVYAKAVIEYDVLPSPVVLFYHFVFPARMVWHFSVLRL
jgi:hypothetical protein